MLITIRPIGYRGQLDAENLIKLEEFMNNAIQNH